MVDSTDLDNNRIRVINADDVSFDTDRPSITLFPDAYRIVKTGYQITFPSPIQSKAYFYTQAQGGVSRCALWSTLLWQEWGPGESNYNEVYYPAAPQNSLPGPTTRTLASTNLGSVPAAANYLDIRVRLTRTTAPPAFCNAEPPIVFFPEGEWINLPGGSCPCEHFAPLVRHFDIVRSGNDIILNRYQSVRNSGAAWETSPAGTAQADIGSNQSGWNSANYSPISDTTSYGNGSAQFKSKVDLAVLINAKDYSASQKRPNQGDACSGPHPDLTSVYTGDIIITPGIRK